MLGWTLGGYPSPPLDMVKEFYAKVARHPSLDEIYEKVFPEARTRVFCPRRFTKFSEAFDEYPFSMKRHLQCTATYRASKSAV